MNGTCRGSVDSARSGRRESRGTLATESHPNPLEASASAVPVRVERHVAPLIDRDEALRLLREARRMYGVADVVQKKRIVGGIESSVQAHRSLVLVFRLLSLVGGDSPPE